MRTSAKLLVYTRHTPLPMDDGGGLYLFDILSFLSENGVAVEVDWFEPHGHITRRGWWVVPRAIHDRITLRFLDDIAIGRLRLFPKIYTLPLKARLLHYAKTVLQGLGLFARFEARRDKQPPGIAKEEKALTLPAWLAPPSPAETAFARKRARAFKPSSVLTNFCWLNSLFDQVPGKPPRFTITQDVWHKKAASMAQLPNEEGFALFDLAMERRLLMQTDVTIAITEDDAVLFRQFLPGRQVLTVPMGFALRPLGGRETPGTCLFVGSGNTPNVEGLKWFLDDVWPRVLCAVPGANLIVCGGIKDAFPEAAFPQVRFLGRQESLEPFYAQAQAVVCPLLRGGGMKIKLVEALSYGKACVTTSVGIQGVGFLSDAVVLADDAEGFAAGVASLLQDARLRREIQTKATASVKEHLSREACYTPLLKLIA